MPECHDGGSDPRKISRDAVFWNYHRMSGISQSEADHDGVSPHVSHGKADT